MKKTLLALLLINLLLPAQNTGGDIFYGYGLPRTSMQLEHLSWLNQVSNHKKIKRYESSSSKDKKYKEFFALDEAGQETEFLSNNRSRFGPFRTRYFYHARFGYNNNQHVKTETFTKKGESESVYTKTFFAPGKISQENFATKGKSTRENIIIYNADSTRKEYRSYKFKGGSKKITSRYEYDYYADKQRKQTRSYNRKNKLKFTWNYACNPKGDLIQPKTMQVCKNTGTDNKGRILEVVYNTNSKGDKTKTITTYYNFNGEKYTSMVENFYVNTKGKEIKTNEWHLPDSVEKFYSFKYYNKKGNVIGETRFEYAVYNHTEKTVSGRTYTTYNKKGKVEYASVQKYSEKGIPLSHEHFVKGRPDGKSVYEIKNENLYTITRYSKKGKQEEVITNSVEYY